jgi:PAS domain S-box-containing protein
MTSLSLRSLSPVLAAWTLTLAWVCTPVSARAQMATAAEARTAAGNFVNFILNKDGAWGNSPVAAVTSVQEIRRDNRVLGYYCPVNPSGYLVLSLYKDLAPVRVYAGGGSIDPDSEDGTANILKDRLQRLQDALERRIGRALTPADDLRPYLDVNYRGAWEELTRADFNATSYRGTPRSRGAGMNYVEGDSLLTTTWNQSPPYNDDCASLGCAWPDYGYYNTKPHAGCVAIALAQIVKQWEWPPQRYAWRSMLNTYIYSDWDTFVDETGHVATQTEMEAKNEELIRTSEALRGVIRSMINALVVADARGRITLANEACVRALGYAQGELIGRSIVDIFPPGSTNAFHPGSPLWEHLRVADAVRDVETEFVLADGQTIPVSINASTMRDARCMAPSARVAGESTTNSSPPVRATTSPARAVARNKAPASAITSRSSSTCGPWRVAAGSSGTRSASSPADSVSMRNNQQGDAREGILGVGGLLRVLGCGFLLELSNFRLKGLPELFSEAARCRHGV